MSLFNNQREDAQKKLDTLSANGRDENGRMFRGCGNDFESSVIAKNIQVQYKILNRKFAAILASDNEKHIFEMAFSRI